MQRYNPPLPLFSLLLLAMGCEVERDMPLGRLDAESRLVVYCMPSAQRDTTILQVTASLPVGSPGYGNFRMAYDAVEGCSITYTVNGQPQAVHATSPVESVGSVPPGYYYVVGRPQPGDRISLSVAREGYPPVEGSTVVPDTLAVGRLSVRDVSRIDPDGNRQDYLQLMADIAPTTAHSGYYAVQVEQLLTACYYRDGVLRVDSAHEAIDVATMDEPLLNPLTDADTEFEYANNYYGRFYIFDGRQLRSPYTLHLDVSPSGHSGVLRLALYHLTPDYYRYVKSINDAQNNGMADYGLATIAPTYSNVAGGLGFVGAYAVSRTPWVSVGPDGELYTK